MEKVLLVSGSWPPAKCGIGIYTQRFYSEISKNEDFEFVLLTSSEFVTTKPRSYSTPQWRLRDLPTILRQAKLAQPDIVHIQYPTLPYKRQLGINLLSWCLRVKGYPVVITMHEYFQTSLLGRIRSTITGLPAQKLVVSNEGDLRSVSKLLRKKLILIPIAATVPKVTPDRKRFLEIIRRSGLSQHKQTVIFFGFPFPNKRLDILIDAARNFSDNLQLLLVIDDRSNDPYVKGTIEKVRQANVAGASIGIAGYLNDSDLSITLDQATYFVLPQTHPPLTAKSTTVIAASLHGCVVLAAEPAIADLSYPFVSGENCILLPTMSADAIANTINELAKSKSEQTRIATNAKQLNDYFNWEGIAEKYAKLYEGVTKRGENSN